MVPGRAITPCPSLHSVPPARAWIDRRATVKIKPATVKIEMDEDERRMLQSDLSDIRRFLTDTVDGGPVWYGSMAEKLLQSLERM